MTASYSASSLVAWNLIDYWIMDPSRVVRTIQIMASLPFDAPSMFRAHPFKRFLYGGAPGVNSAMKSAKTCLLIDVLCSNVTLKGSDLRDLLRYFSVASGLSKGIPSV